MPNKWGCPNDPPCAHYWHDIYEPGDPYPTCCEPDCPCGKPTRRFGDPVIHVESAYLRLLPEAPSSPDWLLGETLVLNGYRYQHLRRDHDHGTEIFGLVRSEAADA